MNQKIPMVHIILVNYNGFEDTYKCIESLSRITYGNYKIVVVDNASKDDSVYKLKEKIKNITLIESKENTGFAGGNNIGINSAVEEGTDYVLLLNNDTEVKSDFLDHLVNKAEEDNKIGCVGGKIYYFDNKDILWYAGAKINKYTGVTRHIGVNEKDSCKYDSASEQDYITGCMMLVRTEVLKKTGVMDESYFLYYEETDWCVRMRKSGYKLIYQPKAIIYHKVSSSTKNINRILSYYYHRNSYYFIMKNFGISSKFVMFVYMRARLFLKYIIETLRQNSDNCELIIKTFKDIKNKEMGKYDS